MTTQRLFHRLLDRYSDVDFRYADEIRKAWADGKLELISSSISRLDSALTARHYEWSYRLRAKRIREFDTPYWQEVADAIDDLCERLATAPQERCLLWVARCEHFDFALYELPAMRIIAGCLKFNRVDPPETGK